MQQSPEKYDVIIVGAGPAGISAGVWCSDLGLKSIVLEKEPEPGGQLLRIYDPITNYIGIRAENGTGLRDIFAARLSLADAAINTSAKVTAIDPHKLAVKLDDGRTIFGRAIVIATGVRRRRLEIPGETAFAGRGILESGAASRGLVKGKRVVIAGGGDAAFENAIMLAENAEQVTLIHRSNRFSARSEFVSQVINNTKVKIVPDAVLSKIIGNQAVEAVEYTEVNTGETKTIAADAVLIRIGVIPNTGLLPDEIGLDGRGYVVVDRSCMTNIPFVFAVGDIANPKAPTINGAAGDAATAVKAAYHLLAASKRL